MMGFWMDIPFHDNRETVCWERKGMIIIINYHTSFIAGLEEVIVQFKRPHCVSIICISQS